MGDEPDDLPLPFLTDIRKLGLSALRRIYDRGGVGTGIDPDLFQLTSDVLNDGVSRGVMQYGRPNPAFLGRLYQTGQWFAARKTYEQQQALAALLVDGTTKRSWPKFKKAAQGVLGQYNERWLKVEYNTAVRAARTGSRWQEFEDNADLFPNLEYLPSRAATPRPEHKPFYHVVRPINDEFWARHYPPSAYNCLCGTEPTDADMTALPGKLPAPDRGLDENPGQTGSVFSDTHPVTARLLEAGAPLADIDGLGDALRREADYALLRADYEFDYALRNVGRLREQFAGHDPEELAAIWLYSDNGYVDLNAWLRGLYTPASPEKLRVLGALKRTLSSALGKLPPQPGTVFRGDRLTDAIVQQFRDAMNQGTPVTLSAFTSTSRGITTAFKGPQRFVIEQRSGRHIRDISAVPREDEILLDAGTRFAVQSIITEPDGLTVIYLREL